MSSKLDLFYFPGSYYSQKAFLALHEKQIPFKEHLVYISIFGEQNEDWFLKLNPKGLVPAIKDGDDVTVCDSEAIIDYIDKKSDSGPHLVPDVVTAQGQRVSRMRKLLDDVPIEEVTFGVLLNPGLRSKTTEFIKMLQWALRRDKYEKYLKWEIGNFERKLDQADPAQREVLTRKIARYQWKLDTVFNEQHCRDILAQLYTTFDQIEQELEQSVKEAGTEEVWLCGTAFSAADVTMAVMVNRLTQLGKDEDYFSATKRPKVFAYCQRLCERPTVKILASLISMGNMKRLMMTKIFKMMALKAAKVAVVVGAGAVIAYGVHKYLNKS